MSSPTVRFVFFSFLFFSFLSKIRDIYIDYRNGIHRWDYDPTKWFIQCLWKLGLVWDLKETPINFVEWGETDMEQKRLNRRKGKIDYGKKIKDLPIWTSEDVQKRTKEGRILVVIAGVVHDVTSFLKENKHPGGKRIVIERRGRDVTEDFNGEVYNHTNAARNLMSHMRVAKVSKKDE